MRKLARLAAASVAVTIGIVGLGSAPASAISGSYSAYCTATSSSITDSYMQVGDAAVLTDITTHHCTEIYVSDLSGGTLVDNNGHSYLATSSWVAMPSSPTTLTFTAVTVGGSGSFVLRDGSNTSMQDTISFSVGASLGSGGPRRSSAASRTPVLNTLSLNLSATDASCTVGNPTGYQSAWVTLPTADECTQTGATARAGARLLGWSTNAAFPVAVAQAQIDKGWGAIDDTFDGVRMIFIPAGMSTCMSGDNSLFPIWSA